MSALGRLYSIEDILIKKSINLEDKLYNELKIIIDTEYDATISELLNVILEDYFAKGKITYYGKSKEETVTYRSIMIRKSNLENLQEANNKTSISITRILNGAVKEFLQERKGQKDIR